VYKKNTNIVNPTAKINVFTVVTLCTGYHFHPGEARRSGSHKCRATPTPRSRPPPARSMDSRGDAELLYPLIGATSEMIPDPVFDMFRFPNGGGFETMTLARPRVPFVMRREILYLLID